MSVKRYEWVACDEHSCHCDVVESVEGDMVDYEDYAALEARCAALAAENGVLLAIMNEQAGSFGAALAEGFHDAVMESGSDQLIDIYQRRLQPAIQCIPPTPDTDAFLAEVRAQGVEMMAAEADQLMDEFGDDSYKVMVTADLQRFANAFAAQIRKGVQS